MYADGYKYWLGRKLNNISYFRCSHYASSKCPGRCVSEDGTIRITAAHNHPPEPDRALVEKFRKILTQRAATEKTELHAIYCDEATSRHSDAAMLYTFEAALSTMRKARRKQLPQTPNSVTDIVHILDTSDLFRVNTGSDKDSIYQKTIKLEDAVCMIFMHRKTVDLFPRIDEMHVDGTVEFRTENSPPYHLITFHAIQRYVTAPIVYALVTAKTKSACTAVFAYLSEELNIVPNTIMTDFDQTMQSSLAYIFPEAIIKGCWFHYIDAVLSQIKCLGLQKDTEKGMGASVLRMLLVVPLLPAEYMSPGLESLKKWMKEKSIFSDGLSSLCHYVEVMWLRSIGAEKMSIFGTSRGISNHQKNFNKELSALIGNENPAIWVVLESITQLATKTFVKVRKKMRAANAEQLKSSASNANHSSGPGSRRLQRKNDLFTETIISSATQLWIKTPVHLRNPLQFLQLCSHCINDSIYLACPVNIRNLTDPILMSTTRSSPIIQAPLSWSCEKSFQNLTKPKQPTIICQSDYAVDDQSLLLNATSLSNHSANNFQPALVSISDSTSPICTSVDRGLIDYISQANTSQRSSEPPPLAFLPGVKRIAHKRRLPILSEPPPLIPISSSSTKNK